MKRVAIVLAIALAAGGVAAARAQQPERPLPVTPEPESLRYLPPEQGPDAERARLLRQQIEERFGQLVRTRLELSDPQMQQLRAAMRANQDRRRDLMRREIDLRRAIQGQMQPDGSNDSINRMIDAQGRLRVELAQSDQQFLRDVSFLAPAKRVQLMHMLRDFEQRVQDIARRRVQDRGRDQPGRQRGPDRRPPGRGPRPF